MAMQFDEPVESTENVNVEVNKTVQDAEWDATKEPEEEFIKRKEDEKIEENIAKTLHNSNVSGARENVPDIKVVGDGDTFKLICKASSEQEGWMKSTKAMQAGRGGCVVQVTTQQRNADGSYSVAEALTYVPGVKIRKEGDSHLLVDL